MVTTLSSGETGARQRNNSLDCLRVAAFCGVVVLHVVSPSGQLSTALNVLARFAVPYFFALSGFFSLHVTKKKLIGRIVGTGKLCLAAVVLYFVTSLLGLTPSINSFVEANGPLSTLRDFLIWNAYPSAYPYWFLFALLYVYAFAYIVSCLRCHPNTIISFGAGLFVARFVLAECTSIVPPLGDAVRSWLFSGIPFFCLGMFLRLRLVALQRLTSFSAIGIMTTGILLSFAECWIFGLQECYAATILVVVGCFILCTKHPLHNARLPLIFCGSKVTLIAYLVHYLIITLVRSALDVLKVPSTGCSDFFVLMASICLSLIVGTVYAYASSTAPDVISRYKKR